MAKSGMLQIVICNLRPSSRTSPGSLSTVYVFTFLLALLSGRSFADDPTIVRLTTSDQGTVLGDLISEDEKSLEVFEFESNRAVKVLKSSITRTEKPLTLDDAARYVGLPSVMGRRVSQLTSRSLPKGKIAKVTPQSVYMTLGVSSGLVKGQKVVVFRGEGDIIDPDTGAVLASESAKIAELEVTEVNEKISKGRLTGDFEVKLEIGDEIEPISAPPVVAICPLSNNDGSANSAGRSIAEDLTSALVQRDVKVVERSSLDMVLAELLVQNTILFDEKSAQELGKLTGASMVLTGKIVPEKSTGKAHLRLIDVESGVILLAISAPVKLTGRTSSATNSSNSPSSSSGGAGTSKTEMVPTPSGEMESLGKSRSLPKFLTTGSALKRTAEGGVRFQGDDARGEGNGGIIQTRQRDLLEHDFIFEVLVSFEHDDGIAFVGFGPGRAVSSRSKLDDSIYLRLHSPSFAKGEVNVLNVVDGGKTLLGQVPQDGIHMVRLVKEGDTLSLIVDPENDGPTDDDLELVIQDVKQFSPKLNSKNGYLFMSGSGTFHAARLSIIK